jgi:enoyl-CoA hydratase
VVTGAGGAFCAGADLAVLETAERTAYARIYAAFLRVARSPLPTVAAVNGAAAGAGMNLALACDIRLVSDRARFMPRFLDIGLHPGGGHTWLLQRAVGRERALALLLTGVEPRGAEAVEWGLALLCVDGADQLVPEATAMARRAAAHPRVLVERIKATVDAVAALDQLEAAVEMELDAQVWSAEQQHFRERVSAVRATIAGPPTTPPTASGDG